MNGIDEKEIFDLVNHQICNFYPEGGISASRMDSLRKALHIIEDNFQHRNNKYFNINGNVSFDIYNSVQYMLFLYYYSHKLYLDGDEASATKVWYLNKIMHSCDWFYAIDLPVHFGAEHPLGSVLGRAKYDDYFFIYQGVSVGGSIDSEGNIKYPTLGNHVLMFSDSKILGDSRIGNYVVLSANSYVINEDIPDNSIVFGQSPNIVIKPMTKEKIRTLMGRIWKLDI